MIRETPRSGAEGAQGPVDNVIKLKYNQIFYLKYYSKSDGGKVHKIRPSVIHLMRGQVFELEGKKIFTFGGASCHDIDGGILELDDPEFRQKH